MKLLRNSRLGMSNIRSPRCNPPNSGEFGYTPNQPLGVSPRFLALSARQEPSPSRPISTVVAVRVVDILPWSRPLHPVHHVDPVFCLFDRIYRINRMAFAELLVAEFARIWTDRAARQTLASSATLQNQPLGVSPRCPSDTDA